MKARVLHLTLYRKWFDDIALGNKLFEFREIKPYWDKRLLNREYDEIHFVNGFCKHRPWMRVKWNGVGYGQWEGKRVFAIPVHEILEIGNWEKSGGICNE